jgi:hypothetical protein
MNKEKRTQIEAFKKWLPKNDLLEGGELFTIQPPTFIMHGAHGWSVLSKETVKGMDCRDWVHNSPINLHVARLATPVGSWQKMPESNGTFIFLDYFVMGMCATARSRTQTLANRHRSNADVRHLVGIHALWMEFDKHVFLPVAAILRSKDNKHSFVSTAEQDTVSCMYPKMMPFRLMPPVPNMVEEAEL